MEEIKIRNFLEIPYEELEEQNLRAKEKVCQHTPDHQLCEHYLKYLSDEKQLKAVSICFADLEGRFHLLDYDKKFLVKSHDNLTFDGSSVNGFAELRESDLRLAIDWGSFRWLPSDVFGPGKVLAFGLIRGIDGSPYGSDMRGQLKELTDELHSKESITANVACEIEGFLFEGLQAEQNYHPDAKFDLVTSGGYFHSLPGSTLRKFIDKFAEAQRALGFENEKDHPEVAPSQFELNYSYTDALIAADQIQLYKLLARQIAATMGCTASFLPKPLTGLNGNGMHTNISLSKDDKNTFFEEGGEENLSEVAWDFVDRLLLNANDLCLVTNPSVNAYRRLDPNYEAPNQIKASAVDRSSMVRIPAGNKNSARIEMRSVAPDANPYMLLYCLLRIGREGPKPEALTSDNRRTRTRFLPDNIYDAMRLFKQSSTMSELLGSDNHQKYWQAKKDSADRCPKELGTTVKACEILYHHEVTNQLLWSQF